MKKKTVLFITTCVVFCFAYSSSAAYAQNPKYSIDELGISLTLPENLIVFTRNIKDDDPNLNLCDLTKDEILNAMTKQNIFLSAWNKNDNYEIVVSANDGMLKDFSQLSNTVLSAFATIPEKGYGDIGVVCSQINLYQNSKTKFIKIYLHQTKNDTDTIFGLQYNTTYRGKAVNIIMYSYSSAVDEQKETILKKIIDDIDFQQPPKAPEQAVFTPKFVYKDPGSGVEFTIPNNWVKAPLNKKRESIAVKFTSTLEDGMSILFGYMDIYDKMPAEYKMMIDRNDINNSMFTKADAADAVGCSINDVSIVTYGEKQYFLAETTVSRQYMKIPMSFFILYDNGYMYMYQFNGHKNNKFYRDFENFVASAHYPDHEK